MQTTIFYENDEQTDLSVAMVTALKEHFSSPDFTLLEVIKDQIKPCMGCFGCWIKTPGKCVIKNDFVSESNPRLVQSDCVIIVSSIHYGCYSAATKRIIDRFIPNILPFFRKYKNEMHHEKRYKHLSRQIIVAYGEDISDEEKETFIKLTRANATNQAIEDPVVYFCTNANEIPGIMKNIKNNL